MMTTARRNRAPAGALDQRARRLLIELRHAAHLTQGQLASRLGRRQSYVSRIEGGRHAVARADFAAIARALGANPHALFVKVLESVREPASRRRMRVRGQR